MGGRAGKVRALFQGTYGHLPSNEIIRRKSGVQTLAEQKFKKMLVEQAVEKEQLPEANSSA